MTQKELNEVLTLHKQWLESNGNKGKRADLRDAHLQRADLQGADLQGADLQLADLQGADLQGANLRYADLQNADLQDADLQDADLQRANLQRANLQGADLRDAHLRDAHLQDAHLQDAHLQGADLQHADLQRADLHGAKLQGADLQRADLHGAKLQGADLQGADLDYSLWPLWCGSFDVKCDIRLASQLAYHFCRLDSEDAEVISAQNALITLANKFHRVEECGLVKPAWAADAAERKAAGLREIKDREAAKTFERILNSKGPRRWEVTIP